MALKASKLKQIPHRNKDLAFGYVKECETKNKSIIPDMIKYLCLIYLNQNSDKFDTDNLSEYVKIEDDTLTCTDSQNGLYSTYLENIVSKGVHVWRFKCIEPCTDDTEADAIGIVKYDLNEVAVQDDYFFVSGGNGISMDGRLSDNEYRGQYCGDEPWNDDYGRICEAGDLIEMKVDFHKLTLSYDINGKYQGIAFDIDNVKYKAAISTWHNGACYQLVSYQQIF